MLSKFAIVFAVLTLCLVEFCISQDASATENSTVVNYQEPQIYEAGGEIFFSNDFEGARLNGVEKDGDVYKLMINPENEPVNPSPWYSFKVWSRDNKSVKLQLVYKTGMHRYYPKISMNGVNWTPLDSSWFYFNPLEAPFKLRVQTGDTVLLHSTAFMDIPVGPDTTWISAQELVTSSDNRTWTEELGTRKWVNTEVLGESRDGRELVKMEIGEGEKGIIVFSRQHPPEVTGYLAMQSFVEYMASGNEDAENFREQFTIHVYPMLNPDGVDEGHWRHNSGGKDLNRDWVDFEQPETTSVAEDIKSIEQKIYFCIDFHSTWKDIFYTMPEDQESNMPIVQSWLDLVDEQLPELRVVRRGSPVAGSNVSFKWVYIQTNSDGLTYEVGDDTDRTLLKRKAEVAAQSLIKVLSEN